MTKDQDILKRRQKAVYDKVKEYKGNGEKVLAAIIDFAEDHFLSTHQVWKDYSRAKKTYGEIIF